MLRIPARVVSAARHVVVTKTNRDGTNEERDLGLRLHLDILGNNISLVFPDSPSSMGSEGFSPGTMLTLSLEPRP